MGQANTIVKNGITSKLYDKNTTVTLHVMGDYSVDNLFRVSEGNGIVVNLFAGVEKLIVTTYDDPEIDGTPAPARIIPNSFHSNLAVDAEFKNVKIDKYISEAIGIKI